MNFILDTDSYKASHWLQYPKNTTHTFSYLESRGGKYSSTLFFGLQYILDSLTTKITAEMVDEAAHFFKAHGEPFNREGWMHIVNKRDGKLPIAIKAVPEGTVVPAHNVLMTVENTDPECFWLPSYLETMLMRVWYPTTVATQSWHCKQIIKGFLDKTMGNDPNAVTQALAFKLHDFGSRGVSSRESAGIGGAAHLVNFMGSDTVAGVYTANKFYFSDMSGFSIPAAEHSTITTWGEKGEVDAYRNMLRAFGHPGALLAVVSDSYDFFNAVDNIWGKELKDEVVRSGATVVIRPDSGNPPEVVLKTLKKLSESFGFTYNDRGFKVLKNVRVIQGDGINEETIREILKVTVDDGFCASNVSFGMGGALLQQVNRDTNRFAYKCSWARIGDENRNVSKNPKTDPLKASKAGRLDLIRRISDGKFETHTSSQFNSVLKTVFLNGEIVKKYSFEEVRANSLLS